MYLYLCVCIPISWRNTRKTFNSFLVFFFFLLQNKYHLNLQDLCLPFSQTGDSTICFFEAPTDIFPGAGIHSLEYQFGKHMFLRNRTV